MKIMSKAIVALESFPIPPHFEKNSAFRNSLEYISKRLAFPLNIICSNFWLFGPLFKQILLRASNGAAASIRTTTAVTKIYGGKKINALPSEVKAYVNHRIHPNDTFESVLEHDRYVTRGRIMSDTFCPGSSSLCSCLSSALQAYHQRRSGQIDDDGWCNTTFAC